jgi:ribose transport system substrate-binding protein
MKLTNRSQSLSGHCHRGGARPSHRKGTRVAAALMALGTAASLTACGSTKSTSSASPTASSASTKTTSAPTGTTAPVSKNHPVIGMALMTLSNPYFGVMGQTCQSYAAKLGMTCHVEGADLDQATQLSQVDSFIEQHVQALMIAPPDAKAAVSEVIAANKAHIPVFTIDTNVVGYKKAGGKVVEFVQTNNYKGGEIVGKEIASYLHGHGTVGIDDYPIATSVLDRDAGVKAIFKKYPGIKIVSDLNGGGTTTQGLTAASAMLSAHPNLNVIYDINCPSGLGAVDAIKAAGDVGKVAVIGFSGAKQCVQDIESNTIFKAGVMQEPALETTTELNNIKKYLEDHVTIPSLVLTPAIKITKADAAKYLPIAYP